MSAKPKVISLAQFRPIPGEHRHEDAHQYFPRYYPAILRAVLAVFPGWEVWIHHDDSLDNSYYGAVLRNLAKRGVVTLRYCGPTAAICQAMLWRLYPVLDGAADAVLCRDLDSLPTPRERWAVEDWLDAGKTLHIFTDHRNQGNHDLPHFIPGGLCGFRPEAFQRFTGLTDMRQVLNHGRQLGIGYHCKGDDQTVINSLLTGLVLRDDFTHHEWDPKTNRAQVRPRWTGDMQPQVHEQGNALCDYTGGVFNIRAAIEFYDHLATSWIIADAEREVGECWPEEA